MSKINRFLATAVALESQPIGEATEVSTLESTEQIKTALNAEEELAKEASAEEAQEAASDEEIIQMNEATATLDETATALESIAQLMDYALSTGTTSIATNGMAMLAMDLALKPVGMSSAMESIALEDDDKDGSKNAKSIGEKAKAIAKSLIEAIVNMFKRVGDWISEKISFGIKNHDLINNQFIELVKKVKTEKRPHTAAEITSARTVGLLATEGGVPVDKALEAFVADFWRNSMFTVLSGASDLIDGAFQKESNYEGGATGKTKEVHAHLLAVEGIANFVFKEKMDYNHKDKTGFTSAAMKTAFVSIEPYFTSNVTSELNGVSNVPAFILSNPIIVFGVNYKPAASGVSLKSADATEIEKIADCVDKVNTMVSGLKTFATDWEKTNRKVQYSLANAASQSENQHVNLKLLKKVTTVSSALVTSLTGMQIGLQLKLSRAAYLYARESFELDGKKA